MRTPVAPLAALLVLLLAGAPLAPLVQGAYLVPAPDLVVDSMTTPDAVAGASVTFSAVVRNAGNAPAGPFDVQFQVDAAIVGTGHVNAAAPGNAYAVSCPTAWVALAGNHTLAVVVDPGYAVSESNETNNSGNQTFHVRAPDLVVLDFSTTPANPIVGDGITFHANVTNRGDAGTGVNVAVSFYVRVNGTGYEQLYPAPDGAPLAPGATATFTSGTFVGVEGNHTVRVETDHYNRVRESDETNNNLTAGFVVTQPRPGMMPDLLASLVAPNKSPLRAGDSVTFSANLRNVGNASAGAFTVRFEIDGAPFDDVRSGGLRQGFPYYPTSRAWSATPGNHVIRATADVFDEVAELDESNNAASATFRVNVTGIDLAPTSVGVKAPLAGDTTQINATIGNLGDTGSGAFSVRFFLDGAQVGTDQVVTSLAAGATKALSSSTFTATLGSHVAGVQVDPLNTVGEGDETNNWGNATFDATERNPPADLVVTDVGVSPASPIYGDLLVYHANVTNAGPGAAGTFDAWFYSGLNGTQGARTCTTSAYAGPLAAGQSQTITCVGPRATQVGTLFLRAEADPTNRVRESDESNNLTTTFDVTGPRPGMLPDLVINSLDAGSNVKAGDRPTFRVAVQNQGNATANGTVVRLYVDGQAVGDVVIPTLYQGTTLGGAVANWTATEGPHTLLAVADPDGAIAELNEANNNRTVNFTVAPASGIDLVPTSLYPTPAYPSAGYPATFSANVRNQGDTPSTSFYVRFLVDGVAVGADKLVPALQAGGSTTVTSDSWIATRGTHTVTVVVDSGNNVGETHEDNNSLSTSVVV